ncbi:TPR domain protein [Minicystis rosea]|nr:TPR domain protein [Minicystis rosea]
MSEPIVLERDVQLSQSLLWELQRAFFEREGPRAFSGGAVPHYITSNPFIAGAYATVVQGFLRDCRRSAGAGEETAPRLFDPREPVYIVELGAGSGRFAHHFLKRLFASLRGSILEGVRFIYVLTDLAERSIEALRAHPRLQPFVARGQLDFAHFDAMREGGSIDLLHAGHALSAETVKNPLVVIANYFFDGIPQDAFRVEDGELHETLITLVSPDLPPDRTAPDLLSRVELAYSHRPIGTEVYHEPDLDRILAAYAASLPDTNVLFPCAALRCLRGLHALSGGRLLVLSADKGYHGADLADRPLPGLANHGSFSMTVDYEAIGRWFTDQGGQALYPARRRGSLEVAAFLSAGLAEGFVETRSAFEEAIEQRGPDDFFAMKKATEKHYEAMTLAQILAWVRMSGWDANIFLGALPSIMDALPSTDAGLLADLHHAVMQVWDIYYPIGEERDVAFHLGCLLLEMGCLPEALEFHERSLDLYGPTASTLHGMGICHQRLGRLGDALRCMEEALLLDPGHEEAKAARSRVAAEMGQRER